MSPTQKITPVGRLLRFAFRHLYTRFAWAYDLVAAGVSFGEWKQWGRAVIPFLPAGQRLLEVGHGPGHLHLALRQLGYPVAGIDLSPQMGMLASRCLARAGLSSTVARASVYQLPFPDASFGAVVSTFPAEFIFSPIMLAETCRVLWPGGRLLVVPNAPLRITGFTGVLGRFIRVWYRAGRLKNEELPDLNGLFGQGGFGFTEHRIPSPHAKVIVWVCEKMV
jgi:ubiquinone/menaquinone biosynthesis C-methylase UbiE